VTSFGEHDEDRKAHGGSLSLRWREITLRFFETLQSRYET
jgi:hypothetical protein